MADIRINSLPTTASASSSDDFLALDGATNGTRKLNAFSPTFGGNLTVSGTGTHEFSGPISVSTSGSTIATFRRSGSSGGFTVFADDTGPVLFPTDNTDSIRLNTGGVTAVTISSSQAVTLSGNLTVSGGTVTSGTGTLTLNSSANTVVLQSAGTTALTLDSSQNATFAGTLTLPNDKAIYFKQVGGTAQRFALNSGDVIYIEPDQLHKISIGGAGVTNVGAGGIGVAGNSVFNGSIAIGNTVNTVSPTSPNRTITMVIGGTTYYIHAKTTND